ncbi:sensor domain-containing diguanylate cyclase [Chitiniphilus eburneus]|uniref:diguanylate cyclase n=1 Tax=Chitiniphilus eburneus TaxID=2571148 RepID=A0A4U0PYT6_9NEIS|nr:diguanylate cyclase [Chitiniphilus eburneus]TJZ73813.1 diguanylate cyclase [Chitiniphilus eburneus]
MIWSARQSTTITVFAMLFGLGMISILGYQVSSSYQAEVAQARARTDNLSQILEAQMRSALREVDLVLRDLEDRITPEEVASESLGEAHNKTLQSLLLDKLTLVRQADNILLIGPDGVLSHRALDIGTAMQPFDRAYLDQVRDDPYRERLYARTAGKTQDGLLLARRYETPQGAFGGLVAASVPSAYFNQVLENLDLGRHGFVMLVDEGGSVITQRASGKGDEPFKAEADVLQQLKSGALSGGLTVIRHANGATRLVSYRQITGSPFFIIVGMSSLDYLATWRDNTLYYLTGGSLLLAMALMMIYFFWRSHRLARNLQQKESRLNVSESRFRQMIETIPVALVLARLPECFITYINQQAARTFDIPQAGALSLRAADFYLNSEDFREQLQAVGQAQGIRNIEVRMRRWSGESFWASLSMSSVAVGEEITLMIGISDITERKRLEGELKRRATTDGLSGLTNRAYFMEVANQELARASRYKRPLALLMLDIDHFKRINDSYGHDVGDMAIKAVAKVLGGALRDVDIVARMGGEEFTALLPETSPELAQAAAERVRTQIEAHRIVLGDGTVVQFTGSIGISALRPEDQLIDDLLKRADVALYHAKHHGRNQAVVYDAIPHPS